MNILLNTQVRLAADLPHTFPYYPEKEYWSIFLSASSYRYFTGLISTKPWLHGRTAGLREILSCIKKHPRMGIFSWLRLQVTNSLTGVERYKSDTVCIEFDRSNNEPRGGAAMNENERNYSAYLHNAVNSAAPIAKFSSFASSTPSISTYTFIVFSRRSTSRR